MSVVAHTRPELIQRIFHPDSRKYRKDGLYTMMLFSAKTPVIITVDDNFMCKSSAKTHAFVKLTTNENGVREIWPLLIEKAYAKLYGSYSAIEGGLVEKALESLTNGAPLRLDFRDKEVEQQYNTGELWSKMVFWKEKNYLMGCGSPSGSDTDVSSLGIVQGHAYSILDIALIDGHKLVQLRNPWGNSTEWKGAWGDHSKEWNERRKRIAYERMEDQAAEKAEIGAADGIFWMAFGDFYMNFNQLSICRFFDKEYKEVFFESEWSKEKTTAGGCTNYDTCGYNPQMKVTVISKDKTKPVEVFMQLRVKGVKKGESFGIGF